MIFIVQIRSFLEFWSNETYTKRLRFFPCRSWSNQFKLTIYSVLFDVTLRKKFFYWPTKGKVEQGPSLSQNRKVLRSTLMEDQHLVKQSYSVYNYVYQVSTRSLNKVLIKEIMESVFLLSWQGTLSTKK